ncbi:MAG: phospholipase [Gemmatimonas sp.]
MLGDTSEPINFVDRRTFLAAGLTVLAGALSCSSATASTPPEADELQARPRVPGSPLAPGFHTLGLGVPRGLGLPLRDGLLYIPPHDESKALPLVVLLHGATGAAANWFGSYQQWADINQFAMLAPDSRDFTWDLLDIGSFGPDVRFIDQALNWTFDHCRVDAERIAFAGFSDGASYALSLGLSNANFVNRIVAFSGCLLSPGRIRGKPQFYVTHGTNDGVLPINPCSRHIVSTLTAEGYGVTYTEFDGGHEVPVSVSEAAMAWLKSSWRTV